MVSGRANGIIRCCPCHIAAMSGVLPSTVFVKVLGNGGEAARALHETQIACEQEADRLLAELRPA